MVSPPVPDGSASGGGRPQASGIPEIPECRVTRDGDVYRLTHESGRTAIAYSERGAMLVGMALRILAECAEPDPSGSRVIEWRGDSAVPFRTGDLP